MLADRNPPTKWTVACTQVSTFGFLKSASTLSVNRGIQFRKVSPMNHIVFWGQQSTFGGVEKIKWTVACTQVSTFFGLQTRMIFVGKTSYEMRVTHTIGYFRGHRTHFLCWIWNPRYRSEVMGAQKRGFLVPRETLYIH